MSKPGQTHGGKGSARRNANEKAYADNWEKIFGKGRPNVNNRQSGEQNGNTNSDTTNKK